MLGILLLLVALILFFNPRYRYLSYFLYLSFMMGYSGGFGLWTDAVLGMKNKDLAIIYTFAINVYLILQGKFYLPKLPWVKYYKILSVFIGLTALFSLFYYHFSPYQVLQGGRDYLLIASLPILIRIKPFELDKIMRLLILVVAITSALYILQIVLGRPIMPYNGGGKIDPSTGLIRLYNSPANLSFFLTMTFIAPYYFSKRRISFYRILFFVALVCTLGRTGIFTGIMTVFLALILTGKFSKTIKYGVLIGLLMIPFIGTLSNRFEKGGTENDLQQIMAGNFDENYQSGGGATMTYRLAWVYERADYLLHRPLGEQIFGMGFISDSQPIVHRMYNFKLGLTSEETGQVAQLSTPDIAYGNLLTKLGFVGTVIYLIFAVHLAVFFFKQRKQHPLFVICSAFTIVMFIISFAGSSRMDAQSFSFLFIFVSLYLYQQSHKSVKSEVYESHTH